MHRTSVVNIRRCVLVGVSLCRLFSRIHQPLSEIPYCLIKLTIKQWDELRHELRGIPTTVVDTDDIYFQADS